jgi:hypothetical protein
MGAPPAAAAAKTKRATKAATAAAEKKEATKKEAAGKTKKATTAAIDAAADAAPATAVVGGIQAALVKAALAKSASLRRARSPTEALLEISRRAALEAPTLRPVLDRTEQTKARDRFTALWTARFAVYGGAGAGEAASSAALETALGRYDPEARALVQRLPRAVSGGSATVQQRFIRNLWAYTPEQQKLQLLSVKGAAANALFVASEAPAARSAAAPSGDATAKPKPKRAASTRKPKAGAAAAAAATAADGAPEEAAAAGDDDTVAA